ncbi:MAG: hypothetical protein JXX28_06540 [Deltaproteobacteria bacterium]|nr:hypothetical protein [Deltaproteobacteria bacterium]
MSLSLTKPLLIGASLPLAGCLYMGPPWSRPVNDPPTVLLPVSTDNTIQMISDPTTLTVLARDPEGDEVHFEWNLPAEFEVEHIDLPMADDVYSSHIAIARDDRLDGFVLKCVVTDLNSSSAEQIRWELQVSR